MKVYSSCNGIVNDKSLVNDFRCINVGNVFKKKAPRIYTDETSLLK